MYNYFILQNLSIIYDIEIVLRFFVTGEVRYLDAKRLGTLFPTRCTSIGGRRRTRREDPSGDVLTNLEEIGKFRKLDARAISGNVPHRTLRPVLKHVFECLNKDAGQCTAKDVRV